MEIEKEKEINSTPKYIEYLDEELVTINNNGKLIDYTYPAYILTENVKQCETYERMKIDSLLDKFINDCKSTCVIAYGQTGSGKTHTMFGDGVTRDEIRKNYGLDITYDKSNIRDSKVYSINDNKNNEVNISNSNNVKEINENSLPEGWGIFPRTLLNMINRIDLSDKNTMLTVSVIEIYLFQVFDLLNGKNVVSVKCDLKKPMDYSYFKTRQVRDISDIQDIVEILFTERQARTTRMNDTSSRSHCIATISYSKTHVENDETFMTTTNFQFVDLSGSERNDKNQNIGYQAIKKELSGIESVMINWDLWALGQLVDYFGHPKYNHMTNKQKRQMMDSSLPSMLCACLFHPCEGHYNVCVFICLSMSKYNGAESNFSVQFGERLSHLKVNPINADKVNISKAVKEYRKELKENYNALVKLEKTKVGMKNKVYPLRKSKVETLTYMIEYFESILGKSSDIDNIVVQVQSKGMAIQKPATNGFNFDSKLFNYKLKGEWDNRCKMIQSWLRGEEIKNEDWKNKKLHDQRKIFDQYFKQMFTHSKIMKHYSSITSTEEVLINKTKVFIHKKKKYKYVNSPALVYYHGGGCVFSSAELYIPILNRYCHLWESEKDKSLVVFNVDYGLAPETKCPNNINDAYEVFKYIYNNASKWNVDSSRLCVIGESGGGYITTGIGMKLSLNNESYMCKLLVPIIPMTSNNIFKENEELFPIERKNVEDMKYFYKYLSQKKEIDINDKWLFPNEMGDEIAMNFPQTVIMTSEFDALRRAAEELAVLLQNYNKLMDYVCHPGTNHGWYIDYDHPTSKCFYSDSRIIFDNYLF